MTGATGSLGSHILDELLADPVVETVYCLCRAKNDTDAANRLAASMNSRKLLTRFSGAHTKANANASERVVALAADLPAVRLGLDDERYREIAHRATVIIHVRPLSYPLSFASLHLVAPERLGGQFQIGHLQVRIISRIHSPYDTIVERQFRNAHSRCGESDAPRTLLATRRACQVLLCLVHQCSGKLARTGIGARGSDG